jgi:CBS domain-containing protein
MPMEDTSVEKYMSKEVDVMSPDINLFDAAQLFLKSKRRRFPVVEDGKIIGIVSQKDILRTALMLKGFSWKHK